MSKAIIAIDPGKSGGIAVKFPKGTVLVFNCPDSFYEMFWLLHEQVNLLSEHANGVENILGVLEKVHAMPGQGVTSMFTFGQGYGAWQMALIALKIPYIEVPPQTWMKKLGTLPKEKKERKNCIKDMMQKRYPNIKVTLNTADALAIMDVYSEGVK